MEKPHEISDFYSRWDIGFNDEQGWEQFKKRVINSLGVFQFYLNGSQAEERNCNTFAVQQCPIIHSAISEHSKIRKVGLDIF